MDYTNQPYTDPAQDHEFEQIRAALALQTEEREENVSLQLPPSAGLEIALETDLEGIPPVDSRAVDLIVRYETGGKAYYNRFLSKPTWPGFSSGVTIGFGYDLGYNGKDSFSHVWKGHLKKSEISILSTAIGLRAPRDRARIDHLLPQFSGIIVPWESGRQVFVEHTLPKFRRLLHRSLPEVSKLPLLCEGALLSLVFNRGASFNRQGDRFLEMREIKRHLHQGNLEQIPAAIESMKRIWPNSPPPHGLQQRRIDEANLFATGLREAAGALVAGLQMPMAAGLEGAGPEPEEEFGEFAPVIEGIEENTEPSPAELAFDRFLDDAPAMLEVPEDPPAAYWPRHDINSPEYAHLTGLDAASEFSVGPDDIDFLMASNRFQPEGHGDVIVLGIRGSRLRGGVHERENQPSIDIEELRPDHVHFRCTLGFYFRRDRRISLFTGSTVPCPYYMENYYLRINGLPHKTSTGCNLMPSGSYTSRVGTHGGGSINPAVRTTDPDNLSQDAIVTVLRTTNDVAFGNQDTWDRCKPYDNIHCSYFLNKSSKHEAYFSSAGCSTVRGRKDPSDQWAKFQAVLNSIGSGNRVDYLLLTGKEYALASRLRSAGSPPGSVAEFGRLRTGSRGDEVSRLQSRLGISATGYFGPSTKLALTRAQRKKGVPGDGIFNPTLDRQLDWQVFG